MLVSQAHSFAQQARLAITLAWIAGYTNILTILTCGTVTSHVTGTVSQWGRDLFEGRWSALGFVTFLLAAFIAGAMLSAVCTETGRRRGWESIYVLPMALQAVLLAAFAVGVEWHDHQQIESGGRLLAMTGLASMAMGLQNATITRISGGVVRTTHMTGVFTDLGLELVQFLYWLRDSRTITPRPPLPAHTSVKRLALLAGVAASFALGAGLGAAAYGPFPRFAMLPPVFFLLWVIYADIRAPICEIEESPLIGGETGFQLPGAIALYRLRKDRGRKGRVQRLPDLLRWSDRLPPQKTIIILDVGEITDLDSNAALELRAMIKQTQATGRHLLFAGMTTAQYTQLRRAGAADSLDPHNVCPDLELAVARGLMLLEAERR